MTTLTPFDSRDPVNVAKGGTGNSSYTTGDILYATGATTLSKLPIGTQGQQLMVSSSLPSWQNGSTPPFDYYNNFYLAEDFYVADVGGTMPGTTTTGGLTSPQVSSSSATRGTATISQESTKPGIQRIGTGTTTSGNAAITGSFVAIYSFGGGAYTYNFYMRIPTLSDGTDRFTIRAGFLTTSFTDSTNGLYFKYSDNLNSGNWIINAYNGTLNPQNTNTPVDTNWHKYTITLNAAANSAAFYIDDVQVSNSPLVANIPTSSRVNFNIVKSAGTTARSFDIDFYEISIALTNRRY